MTMIKTCQKCGQPFETNRPAKLFCPVCNDAAWIERRRERDRVYRSWRLMKSKVDAAVGKPTKSLTEWSNEAAECNLDYGTYRALIEQGKTFDELKAQRDHRPVHMHAHGHHTRSIRDA